MNDTIKTNEASPVSAAFGEHPFAKNEAKSPDTPPAKKAAKAAPKAKPAPAKKAAKAAPKAKPAPAKKAPVVSKTKAVKAMTKPAPKAKAPKSVVKRVGGDNKILFTFRIADTLLADINTLAAKHSMTPAALIRGALNDFIEQHGPKRGRAK